MKYWDREHDAGLFSTVIKLERKKIKKGKVRDGEDQNSIRALNVSWSLNHAQALVPSMIIALLHYGPFRLYKEGTPRGNSMHSSGSAIELIT